MQKNPYLISFFLRFLSPFSFFYTICEFLFGKIGMRSLFSGLNYYKSIGKEKIPILFNVQALWGFVTVR